MNKRLTVKGRKKEAPADQQAHPHAPNDDRWQLIAQKAYELYEQRSRADGHDLEDWLKAEAIVNGRAE